MRQDIADRWVAALRSGEYKQTVGRLHGTDTNGFCCLGVLCDLVKDEIGGKWRDVPAPTGGYLVAQQFVCTDDFEGSMYQLPAPVKDHVGMRDPTGTVWPEDAARPCWSLSEENDNGRTFEEIADLIENHVEEL